MSCVLIVDDTLANRDYLASLLRTQGHEVLEAANGAEALDRARSRGAVDLVIADLLMPVMDGYTLLRHWKADPTLATAPFIVYTATYTDEEDQRLAHDLGADAFVLKPSEPEDFLVTLADVLAADRQPRRGVSTAPVGGEEAEHAYSRMLIRKLEEKSQQLAASNAALEVQLEEQLVMEDALRASEERLSLFARATHDAIWDWDLAADTRWWNEGLESLFGHAVDDPVRPNQEWVDLLHPDDRDAVVADIRAALAGGDENWVARYRFRRADGRWAQVEDQAVIVRDGQGRAVRMVGGINDETDRVALEARLRGAHRLEAVGQLTGGVAHDFNNLLTVILGNAELLQASVDEADQELVTLVENAARRGAELTRTLLAFARQQPLDPAVVDLNARARSVDALLNRTLGEHIRLHYELDARWHALVDGAQLENALLNLCLNARDAMSGGGDLTIATRDVQVDQETTWNGEPVEPGDYVCLRISDTGSGIAEADLTRVFEPFYTTKAEGKGSGLGLAMVYGFIRQSRGQVRISSTPGEGTSIELYLPRGVPIEPEARQAPAETQRGTGETLLLVEDDPQVRAFARRALERLGYTVVDAAEGARALDLLDERGDVDLLVTDMVMPHMSGTELARRARSLRPDLRILFTSGYTDQDFEHEDGPRPGFLQKPYSLDALARGVRAALRS